MNSHYKQIPMKKVYPESYRRGFALPLIIIFIIILSFAGFVIYRTVINPPQKLTDVVLSPPTTEQIQEATKSPDATANWKTYTNIKYGYSVKYPPTWVYSFGKNSDSWVLFDISKQALDGDTEGGLIDIIVIDKVTEPLILDDARNVTVGKKIIKIGEIQGEQADFNYRIQSSVAYKGKTYSFNLSKPAELETYNQILSTFKFTN